MHTRLFHSLALCGALSLTACSGASEQSEEAGWCVDLQECEADASNTQDAGADTNAPQADSGADAMEDASGVDVAQDAGDDAGEDAGEDAGIERPERIEPPVNLGAMNDLVVHAGTACALVGGKPVCWGDNTHGQAQPPSEDLWADRIVLTERYGCVVGPSVGVRCWGDGAGAVAAADGTRLNGRFTLYGASANEGVLCQSSAYGESTTEITCYAAGSSWQVGPEGAVAVDVQYDLDYAGLPTVCYALAVTGGYTYQCMHGDAVLDVTTSLGDWSGSRPTIRNDGRGQVAVLLADGNVEWYELSLDARADPDQRESTLIDVDWGPWRDDFDVNREDVQLVSPNCFFYNDYVLLCRGSGGEIRLVARQSTKRAAVHEQPEELTYCFETGYSDANGDLSPVCTIASR